MDIVKEDPFLYLESLSDSSTIQWFRQQNKQAQAELSHLAKNQELIYERILDAKSPDKVEYKEIVHTLNNYIYALRKHRNEPGWKLIRRSKGQADELLFDPQQLDSAYTISYFNPSWDDQKVAIALTKYDREVSDIIVLDTETKQLLPGQLSGAYPNGLGGIQWLPGSQSFVYSKLPITDEKHEDFYLNIFLVRCNLQPKLTIVDTLFSADKCPEIDVTPAHFPYPIVTNENNKYLIVFLAKTTDFAVYRIPIDKLGHSTLEHVFNAEDQVYPLYENLDKLVYLQVGEQNEYSIKRTSNARPASTEAEDIVVMEGDYHISDFVLTSEGIYYARVKNGIQAELFHCSNEGEITEVELPSPAGRIVLSSLGPKSDKLWVRISGWTMRSQLYEYHASSNSFEHLEVGGELNNLDVGELVVKEVQLPSHDGAMVPLSIIHRADAKLDGSERAFLFAYGAYGIPSAPSLHTTLIPWLEHNGIYAVAHVRGGGEKGDAWHKAGRAVHKSNSWKDFIACSEYLIENNYTNPDMLCIKGSSAGGVCIGRAIEERPDLYAAALVDVGFMNPYRHAQIHHDGYDDSEEWGLYADSLQRQGLAHMDPYLNISYGVAYPAMLMTAGMNDSRVKAWHPGKFAARIQEATSSDRSILLLTDFEGGHGVEASGEKKYRNRAQGMAFLLWQTGHPDYQPER